MTSALFVTYIALTAAGAVALAARYLPRRQVVLMSIALGLWLAYVGVLAGLGVVANAALRPPGITFIVVPAFVAILLFFGRSRAGGRISLAIPVSIFLGFQTFRIGVELFLHQLALQGLAPRMLTFAGANVDIVFGVTAPLIAWLSTRGDTGLRIAMLWNALGLLSLANVATRALLTAPGPLHVIHAEVANIAFGAFPYIFIPGFFAPLAVALHVLALRALRSQLRVRHGLSVNGITTGLGATG